MEACQAEAVYMRAVLASTGAHPQHVAFNPKAAFRDFESAARGGYAGAWFRLGRDYETFGDFKHAKECFERGAKLGVESCLYRLGMAHLLGQLTLTANTSLALPILQRAAILASLECPQPAYVYSLLLLSEFASIPPIPAQTFASLSAISAYPPPPSHPSQPLTPLIPLGSSPHLESRHHLERAAYLHYGPAQYKLGHAYEFADPPFFFDPLLSVQYYSLASQNGEVEADMALSKWFLCGSTGARTDPSTGGFEKDEGLALTFAQKASARNLASAHFAMGYYAEVGVGRPASVPDAIHYYTLAAQAGNADANQRLEVLKSNVQPKLLDKGAHEQRLERTRTMAQRRTEEQPMSPPYQGQTFPSMREQQRQSLAPASASLMPPSASGPAGRNGAQRDPRAVVELVRKSSMAPAYLPLQSVANNFNSPGSATTPMQSQYGSQPAAYQPAPQSARPSSGHGNGNGGGRWSAQVPARPPSAGAGRQSVYGAGAGVGVPQRPPSAGAGRQSASVYGALPARPPSAGAGSARPTLEQMRASASAVPTQGGYASPTTSGQQGGGGRRPQSPGRRQSPGPGRMGKLSVGVDSVPPVPPVPSGVGVGTPGLSAPPNTAFAGHTPRPSKGAATFAEMGIQGAKAEDKECVVM
ncbi:hypothetical protein DFP72DRAFT_917799 [Ephemerocybe angulata]|uniref:HCP-like protein n=1 Tax=Ephemerocybe angulata TaxID=980116 RepID=A0A8H6HJH7_9AGAR|nr:hypothetical protein DFP72DRAFT_917799 [Tulosesus angulatus]